MKKTDYCEKPEHLQVCTDDILSSTAGRLLVLCCCLFLFNTLEKERRFVDRRSHGKSCA